MGYVHDTQMSQFLAPSDFQKTAGTWTAALTNGVISESRTAAAGSFTLLAPITLPGNGAPLKGSCLKSIEFFYAIGSADASDFPTVALYKEILPGVSTGPISGTACEITIDGENDTPGKRKTQGEHHIIIHLDSPAWIDENDVYILTLTVDPAASTVFKYYGAKVSYTLRV